MARSAFNGPLRDTQIAFLLGGFCIVLYTIIFCVLAEIASSHGASPETMIGLNLGEQADTTEYVHIAHSMLDAGRFALSPTGPAEFARVPGYPSFLVVVLVVFHTLLVVPLIQVVFTACTIALIYFVGVRYFTRPVALAAALLYLLDPIVMYAAWIPITESLFMLFFIGSIYALGFTSRRSWLPFAIGGIFFALSIYVRPVGFYLAPVIAALAFSSKERWQISLRNAIIFLIAAVCVMTPWMLRNYHLAGYFEFSSNRAWQFYAVNMSTFEQMRTGIGYQTILAKNNEQFATQDEHILRSFEYSAKLDAITKQALLAHPFEYLAFHLLKSGELFISSSIVNVIYHMHQFGILTGEHAQGEGAWGMITQHRWRDAFIQIFTHIPSLVERIFLSLLYGSAFLATAISVWRRDKHWIWMFIIFILINAYAIMIGPGSDDTRYRIPVEPFVFLLGGYGFSMRWHKIPYFNPFAKRKSSSPRS